MPNNPVQDECPEELIDEMSAFIHAVFPNFPLENVQVIRNLSEIIGMTTYNNITMAISSLLQRRSPDVVMVTIKASMQGDITQSLLVDLDGYTVRQATPEQIEAAPKAFATAGSRLALPPAPER